MRKAALHNLGCKVNAYEVEAMQQLLEKAGYDNQALVPFLKMKQVHKFYLTYNMRFIEFDPRWSLFYPRGF